MTQNRTPPANPLDEKPYPDHAGNSRDGNQSLKGAPRRIDPEQTDETGKAPPKGRPDQQEYLDVNREERPGEPDKGR